MAKVRQRTWTIPGQRTKRRAWGFVTVEIGKHRRTCLGESCRGCQQVRQFKAEWTREDAENALAAIVLKLEQPKAPASGLTLSQAAERYLAAKARKRSVANDRRILEHFKTEFGKDTALTEITASRISEYRAKRLGVKLGHSAQPLSPAAVNRPLALLRHLLRLACDEWEVLPAVPKIRLEKESQGRLRWLMPEEASNLLEKCRTQNNPNLADLAELALYTGMRQGELLGLTWDRVDRARGVVLLERTKSGRRREVPLNGPADAILARRAPDAASDALVFGTQSWYTFRGHWTAAVNAAGLEDFRFHDLRHTFASWAVQRGATLPELKDLLGHSSLAMVMRYAHLSPEHLRSAVARLDTVLAPPKITQEITHEPAGETRKGSR
jgi:integrase